MMLKDPSTSSTRCIVKNKPAQVHMSSMTCKLFIDTVVISNITYIKAYSLPSALSIDNNIIVIMNKLSK